MNQNIRKKLQSGTKLLSILFCTIVGGYGIATAPESDQGVLEQELNRNRQILEQWDHINIAETNGISTPNLDTVVPKAGRTMDRIQSTESDTKIQTADSNSPKNSSGTDHIEASSAVSSTPYVTAEPSLSVIGDSVFLGAAPSYKKIVRHAVIDAKISRQVSHGLDVAKKLADQGKLGNTVLISLGTNGKFNEATGQAIIDYLGKNRTVYWITAYGKKLEWQKEVNQTIRTLAEKNKTVHVIDWAKEARKHPGWFYQDGIHLNTKGQNGFAKFIAAESTPASHSHRD